MARYLYVTNGVIANIVEHQVVPSLSLNGYDVIPAVTGLESVGDAFSVTAVKQNNQLSSMDQIVLAELFRLTNETRILKLQGALTLPQYLGTLKAQMS